MKKLLVIINLWPISWKVFNESGWLQMKIGQLFTEQCSEVNSTGSLGRASKFDVPNWGERFSTTETFSLKLPVWISDSESFDEDATKFYKFGFLLPLDTIRSASATFLPNWPINKLAYWSYFRQNPGPHWSSRLGGRTSQQSDGCTWKGTDHLHE